MKHSPLRRSTGLATASVPVRKKKCKACKESFAALRPLQTACSPACAQELAAQVRQKQERAADKAKREQLKGIPTLKKEAQEAFNRYVRLRDAGKGCFVCGDLLVMGGVGGGFDAGHIRSRSNADHLRFDERNVYGQCKHCNAPGATKDHKMKAAAIRLLGVDAAEELYADNKTIKWTRDGLREIRDTYRAKARELAKKLEHQ